MKWVCPRGSQVRTTVCLVTACFSVIAQEHPFSDLRVKKKPGQQTGQALVTVGGKARRISQHALEAWPVMNGQNALILVLSSEKPHKGEYRLLFYEGEARKHRDLGSTPFTSAELLQQKQNNGEWAFVLNGRAGNRPDIIVADLDGIHGRIDAADSPKLEAAALRYKDIRTGQTKAIPLRSLLATDMTGIYEIKPTGAGGSQYVQFLRDRNAVLSSRNGQFRAGDWWTDGRNMAMRFANGQTLEWARTSLMPIDGVPAGARLIVRLLHPLSSLKAKEGDPVNAVLISPAVVKGKIFLPQGAAFDGRIINAHGVGFGIKHETAGLTLGFDSARLPDGQTLPIRARLYQVENSRETVNEKGAIQGVRSTGTLGSSAESKIASVATVDPVAYLFTTASATAALGFAEPEILYPAGTELDVQLESPVVTSKVFPVPVPPLASTPQQRAALVQFVRKLPFRTMTRGTNKPSDLTSLMFIGPPDGLRRAFQGAGWMYADQLTAETTFQTLKTISGNRTYSQAPMSVLLLDERPPLFTMSKTTNTFSSRHHIRVFDPGWNYQGQKVLAASSTQDIAIAFSSKQKTFIHVIDQYIDNERSKVLDDLEFTGCVQAAQLLPRSWVPKDAYNSTGDRLRTDGAIAVIRVGDCVHPKTTPSDDAPPPSRFERITRDTMLTIRNDIWRGNLGYQGVKGAMWVHNYFATRGELKPEKGAWLEAGVSGTEFKLPGSLPPDEQSSVRRGSEPKQDETAAPAEAAVERSHRWDPPRYEIGVQGGFLHYPNARFESVGAFLVPTVNLDEPTWDVGFQDRINGGWSVGIDFTLNTWRWVSSEFGYHYQRGKLSIGTYFANLGEENEEGTFPAIDTAPVGLVTRQFEYNILVNLRPRESRWRPYLAAGPALELIALADNPIKQAPKPFTLGLRNVGELVAAYESGSTPALDGGGIYELGLQYGAGIKYRVHPRIMLSLDFRETWAKNPSFLRSGYTASYFVMEGYAPRNFYSSSSTTNFRQQRFTLGAAFAF